MAHVRAVQRIDTKRQALYAPSRMIFIGEALSRAEG